MISIIAVVDEKNGLGKDNKLLCHLPADLRHFKNLTLGKPIIMGRKTYDSIGKPLPGRLNIVLSKRLKAIEGAVVVQSLSEALSWVRSAPEVMIIGGVSLFEEALPLASRVYLTLVHHHFVADVFFPQLDPLKWFCKEAIFQEKDKKNAYDMTFFCYELIKPL